MEETSLKHEEIFRLIHEMIGNARSRFVDEGAGCNQSKKIKKTNPNSL